jgi:hypothetical protein
MTTNYLTRRPSAYVAPCPACGRNGKRVDYWGNCTLYVHTEESDRLGTRRPVERCLVSETNRLLSTNGVPS